MDPTSRVLALVARGHRIKLDSPKLAGWPWSVTVWPTSKHERPRYFEGDGPVDACAHAAELLDDPEAGEPIGGP
ncbi:MAG: hypothetical protein K0V04_43460 [Deltaproteobacteria bacterium]|nr:hypothetical protein [Deltaproteobacteria bacterium]